MKNAFSFSWSLCSWYCRPLWSIVAVLTIVNIAFNMSSSLAFVNEKTSKPKQPATQTAQTTKAVLFLAQRGGVGLGSDGGFIFSLPMQRSEISEF